MVSESLDEEQLRRLYHQVTSSTAEAFAHEIGELISIHLPKSAQPELAIYGMRVQSEDLYPNDYATLLIGLLTSRGYSIASYPVNLNGQGASVGSIPAELINGRPNILVDIHLSRVFPIYLVQLRERGASRTLYTCPTPPPGSLWDYQEETNRVARLQRTGFK